MISRIISHGRHLMRQRTFALLPTTSDAWDGRCYNIRAGCSAS
jgi:hypothetical protein